MRFVAAALLVAAAGTAWSVQEARLRVEATNHTAAVRRIAVSPNEALIATVGDDKTGRIWQASDRRLLATLRVPVGAGDAGRLYGVAFSPDGKEIAVGGTSGDPGAGHRIDVFDAANGVHQRTLALDAGNVVRLLWTRDGRHVVACLSGGNGVRILSPAGRNAFADTFAAPCFGLAELPDGSILASGFDGEIRHYRLQGDSWAVARRIRTEIADPQAIAVSPDGLHFAVGYRSRLADGRVAVDVFDTKGGVLAKRFTFSDLPYGSLGSVAWSRDGSVIAASGRATDAGGYRLRIIMKRIAWPQGVVSSDFVATDTIQDTAPIGQDRFAVASSNGSWTVVPASGPLSPLGASVIDLRGPDNLKVAADARRVSFGSTAWSGPRRFNLPARDLQLGEDNDLESARRSSFFRRIERWENEYRPVVGGQAVKMGPLELSRSAAMLPDDAGVVLGTSRTLRRLGWDGAQIWSVRVATEVTSVNTSRDGKIVVSTQMDGTVRWWRAADGLPLLTLFTSIDDKWVLWTEDGYYDAAPGAESLIGWQVNREDGTGVDYFSIGRFRDKYNRPDVIDRVLDTLDPQRALALADDARRARAAADAQQSPAPKAEAKPAPQADPHAGLLPPVLTVLANRSLQSETTVMRIDFSVRAENVPANAMIVRVDGRPVEPSTSVMPERQDGEALGHLIVPMPARNAELAVMAQAGALLSEPVHLAWVWRPPAPPADPVAPLASIPAASGVVASADSAVERSESVGAGNGPRRHRPGRLRKRRRLPFRSRPHLRQVSPPAPAECFGAEAVGAERIRGRPPRNHHSCPAADATAGAASDRTARGRRR